MNPSLKRLQSLFKNKIGLDPSIVSTEGWNRILKERMALSEIEEMDAYIQYLLTSSIEIQEFAELLVVPETWFFRDKVSIDYLGDYVKRQIDLSKMEAIRILSLPCASGEEPYSLAMMLLENHVPSKLFTIDGIDISKKALAKGEIGEYSRNSFRTKDLNFRDRFFSKDENRYLLNLEIREVVHFSYGNLFELSLAKLHVPYQVIFCRNLLIYLHSEAQKQAVDILLSLLSPEGLLIVSPAEAEIVRSFGLVACGPIKACAFQKKKKTILLHKDGKYKKPIETVTLPLVNGQDRKLSLHTIEEAKKLADLGQLDEALNICHECLKTCNTDPQIYFLIGLIQHALGKEKISEEYFLKTIYLEPKSYEALIYLALIAEQKGETAQAELFHSRAKRLVEQGK
jgi:chemotaxis protein methyltransferase WspC